MSFTADKQTLDDLNLLGKYKPYSVYSLFNRVHTTGGERLLESLFQHPLSDAGQINERSRVFQYFEQKALTFQFGKEQIVVMEDYLGGGEGGLMSAAAGAVRKKLSGTLLRDEAYSALERALVTVIEILNGLGGLLDKLEEQDGEGRYGERSPYADQAGQLRAILDDKRLKKLGTARRLSLIDLIRCDHLFRSVLSEEMEKIMQGIYQLDVYITVGKVARTRGLAYARALPKEPERITTAALRHPGIDKAVSNPVSLNSDSNMVFLTGANMAGKSTFMKAFGIAVYMAHMGFPVAAKEMEFSVMDGIYSSINVPDDLSLGYSHFYAEVLRVKKVAEAVKSGKNMVVIFDELFKGTNVKDAYDATLAVTEAFSAYRSCFFIISTHIIEVGETLRERCDNLQFAFLPTVMDGMIPIYTYKIEEGITTDRHGMLIIENERILEIIQS